MEIPAQLKCGSKNYCMESSYIYVSVGIHGILVFIYAIFINFTPRTFSNMLFMPKLRFFFSLLGINQAPIILTLIYGNFFFEVSTDV